MSTMEKLFSHECHTPIGVCELTRNCPHDLEVGHDPLLLRLLVHHQVHKHEVVGAVLGLIFEFAPKPATRLQIEIRLHSYHLSAAPRRH